MKTKKILTILSTMFATSTFGGLAIANSKSNETNNVVKNNNLKSAYSTFDAKLIGAKKGTFTLEYSHSRHCTLIGVDDKFEAHGNFNFNGGSFIVDGNIFIIEEIGANAFNSEKHKYFHNCHLTIPSTIKKIGSNAFNKCSRSFILRDKEIISLNFEEGIEEIGEKAFYECEDLKQKAIKLPNSVKYIDNYAFRNTFIKEFDLSLLDHVISLKDEAFLTCWFFEPSICGGSMFTGNPKTGYFKIYVHLKNEIIKTKYLMDDNWKSAEQWFI